MERQCDCNLLSEEIVGTIKDGLAVAYDRGNISEAEYKGTRAVVEVLAELCQLSGYDTERARALKMIEQCKILKIHDDGDLTVECKGQKHLVTTEGEVFVQKSV